MRRWLLIQAVLTGPLLAFTVLAMFFGQILNDPPVALAAADDCRLPCWNGITPGQTRIRDAAIRLMNLGYRYFVDNEGLAVPGQDLYIPTEPDAGGVCKVGLGRTRIMEGIVRELTLWFCDSVHLGDMMETLGAPESLLPLTSILTFDDGRTIVVLRASVCEQPISPSSRILFVTLTDDLFPDALESQPVRLDWRGFMPLWRYSQFHAGQLMC